MNKSNYWASKDFSELGGTLMNKKEDYYQYLQITNRLATWKNVNYHYHQTYHNGTSIRSAGDNGEYELLTINHFKNILQHMINMVSGEKVSFHPKTTNTDSKSQKQALLSFNILEYYISERRADRKLRACDKYALLYGEGFVHMKWDADLGELQAYDVDEDGEYNTEKAIKEGDITFAALTPDNVVRDVDASTYDESPWIIVREFSNKWDLAAKYPEISDEIEAITYNRSAYDEHIGDDDTYNPIENDDFIEHYTFYHKKTPAMPNGRMVEFLTDDVMLIDSPLPHKDIPVFRESPEDQENTTFGDTIAFDLVQIQEALNILNSTIITNQQNFGVSTVIVPKNSDYRFEALTEGLSVIEYKEGPGGKPPDTLNLLNTKAEIFNYADRLVKHMEEISGVNSVVRGTPQASLESGSALAMVHSTAIKFNQGRALSYIAVAEDVGTNIVNFLKQFAITKRVIAISGKANRSYLEEFNNDDISDINRVSMEVNNPVMSSAAGRLQIAENLLSKNLITNTEEYLTVLSTGRLEPLIQGENSELMLIHTENEELADGIAQQAILTDNHILHISEHKAVLASSGARRDPEIVNNALAHIQQHLNILQDPNNAMTLTLLQQPVLGGGTPPPGGAPASPGAQQNTAADMPSLPAMPEIPGQGQYNPDNGEAAPPGAQATPYVPG